MKSSISARMRETATARHQSRGRLYRPGSDQLSAGQLLVRLDILLTRAVDHFRRKLRRRRRLVPIQRLKVIAHELLVETRWTDADAVFAGWPEAGRIGSQTFVDEDHAPIEEPEFELGVR